MENLKIQIKIEDNDNLKEAHDLLLKLGFSTYSKESFGVWDNCPKPIWLKTNCFDDKPNKIDWVDSGDYKPFKEITLPELRDLVVLKREENLKEYLRKNSNGTYSYIGTVRPEHVSDFMIEIPEGAIKATFCNGFLIFWKDNSSWNIDGFNSKKWRENDGFDKYMEIYKNAVRILWQRHTHPEELPFIDDEPSLNDQYAEIEKVRQTLNQRQEQYGSFEDVAMITEQMVDVMRKGYYENLAYNQKMALYMICSKMARIVNGNPNHKDSWHDIAGYATLIDNELVSEKDMPF